MHVGGDRFGVVEGAGTHEQAVARRDVVAAPDVGAAFAAEENLVILAASAAHQVRLRLRAARFNELAFDPDVDDVRAAGDALAIATMTRVYDERRVGELVTNRAA